jgi:tetratricopeptide (TPR) repeat protein
MSHAKDIAQNSTAICVAVLGLSAATGSVAISVAGLIPISLQLFNTHQPTAQKVIKRVVKDIENSETVSPETLKAARDLLVAEKTEITVNRIDLPEAAKREDFYSAVIGHLMSTFPQDANPNALRLIRVVMGHAFQACRYEGAFHKPFVQELLVADRRDMTAIKEMVESLHVSQKEKEDLRIQLARAQTELGSTNTLLQGFLATIVGRHVPPEEFAKTLFQMAADWKSAGEQITMLDAAHNLSPRLNDLKQQAMSAYEAENVELAWNLLSEIEEEETATLKHHAKERDDLAKAEAEYKERLHETKSAKLAISRSRLDVERTVALEIEKLELNGGGLDALRAVQDVWYERGRDKGLRFDLEVAIELAKESLDRAVGPDQRGTALNDLGNALQTLGEREGSTDRLHAAVAAYTEALKERTRERVPLDWAMAQMNLGTALRTLGEREGSTDRLHAAVAANTEALKEYTRERVPLDWAATQNNLGTALQTLGERESGTDRLHAAVAAYTEALKERTRARVPLQWAATQNNLGNALRTLGARESGTDRLQEAITAYSEALKEWTREKMPLQWAATQYNLGVALRAFGARESGTDRLQLAVAAYTEALKELTREKVPLQWAMTQGNLCNVELAFFDKTGETAHLDRAQEHLDGAREVFDAAKASRYQAMADDHQKAIDARRTGPHPK